jgi:hypothetical protein
MDPAPDSCTRRASEIAAARDPDRAPASEVLDYRIGQGRPPENQDLDSMNHYVKLLGLIFKMAILCGKHRQSVRPLALEHQPYDIMHIHHGCYMTSVTSTQ